MAFEGAQRSLNRYREVTWDMVNFSSDSPPEAIKQDLYTMKQMPPSALYMFVLIALMGYRVGCI